MLPMEPVAVAVNECAFAYLSEVEQANQNRLTIGYAGFDLRWKNPSSDHHWKVINAVFQAL